MTLKQAQHIAVGMHDGRPGFTIVYTDGERAHFVFHKGIARQLAEHLQKLVADLDYIERQCAPGLRERVSVGESVSLQLTPPPSTGSVLGISGGDGIQVDDKQDDHDDF